MKDVLTNWETLNAFLITCSEKDAEALLKAELKGGKRKALTIRIYSRFNRMRAMRERAELQAKLEK